MTAHPNRPADGKHRPGSSPGDPAVLLSDTSASPTPVPITVWRIDDRDEDQSATEPGAGFASRLAQRLVQVYTRRGDTVVDFDDDRYLHDAADDTGRAYLAVTDAAHLAELDLLPQPITLVSVRWPRLDTPASAAVVADLFTACRLMTGGTACVIAAVRPTPAGATFADHEQALRIAAGSAGFAHVLQITAVSAPGEGDQFLYYATEAEATTATRLTPTGQALHIDLLVFQGPGESR